MKKSFLIVATLLFSFFCRGQFGSNPTQGNQNWNSHFLGAITGDRGIVAGVMSDTAAWNALAAPANVKGVPFIIVNTSSDGKSWRRNSTATRWDEIATGTISTNYWSLTGNAGTSSSNFLGTTDAQPLYFRTGNSKRLTINTNGALGLGTGEDYGTAGYLLSTNGSSTAPTWVNPSAYTYTASNGLTMTGNNTKLGGTLIENTTINGDTYDFSLEDANNIEFTIQHGANNHILLDGDGASRIYVRPDSINFEPYVGRFIIDTLNAQSNASDSMMVWAASGVNAGKVGYRAIPTSSGGTVTGSGTLNYVPKFTPTGTALGNSSIYDDGTNVGINKTSSFAAKFDVLGSATAAASIAGRFIAGTSAASGGLLLGSYSSSYGGFWSAGVTPSTSNYALIAASGSTVLNSTSFIDFGISDAIKWRINSSGNLYPNNSNTTDLGGTSNVIRTGYLGNGIFSSAGASSTPALSLTGNPYTAGTATTNHPLIYANGGTAPTTWSTAGTYFGINAKSGFTGKFLDFHVNGGASVASLDYQGTLALSGNVGIGVTGPSGFLEIAAGSTSKTPLKFNAGAPTTSLAAGNLMFNTGLLILDSTSSHRDTLATRNYIRNNSSSFALSSGSGTTANGTAVDLGGTMAANTLIELDNKTLKISGASTQPTGILIGRSTDGTTTIGDIDVFQNGNIFQVDDNNNLAYYDNTAHTGKFGINTSAPTASLEVVGTVHISEVVKLAGLAFASLPASPAAGMVAHITDSNTTAWGDTITGGGADIVLAWYSGTVWKVIGN